MYLNRMIKDNDCNKGEVSIIVVVMLFLFGWFCYMLKLGYNVKLW